MLCFSSCGGAASVDLRIESSCRAHKRLWKKTSPRACPTSKHEPLSIRTDSPGKWWSHHPRSVQNTSICGTLLYGHGGIKFYDSMKAARRAQVPCSVLERLSKTVGWEPENWVFKHRETGAAEKLHSNDRNEVITLSLSPNSVLLIILWN